MNNLIIKLMETMKQQHGFDFGENECDPVWTTDTLIIEITWSIVCILFMFQAIFSMIKKATFAL